MKPPRIDPYQLTITKSGNRTSLSAHELVWFRDRKRDFEINLAPHPVFRGELSFATFAGGNLIVAPLAANRACVAIQMPRGRRPAEVRRPDSGVRPAFQALDEFGRRKLVEADALEIQLGRQLTLTVDLEPAPPWSNYLFLECSDGRLVFTFGGLNILHVAIQRRRSKSEATS